VFAIIVNQRSPKEDGSTSFGYV